MWFGIWSGPDAYNSVLSKNPGGTGPDFPVLNMHAHAWPLYTAAKLLGVEFHESGVNFHPKHSLSHSTNSRPHYWDSKRRLADIQAGTHTLQWQEHAGRLT